MLITGIWVAVAYGSRFLELMQSFEFIRAGNGKFFDFLRYLFSLHGSDAMFFIAIVAFLVAMILTVNPREQQQDKKEDLAVIENEVEKRIEILNAQHQSEMGSIKARHSSEIFAREKTFTLLNRDIDRLKEQVDGFNQYAWLHAVVDVQAKDISNYVELVGIRWCYEELDDGLLLTVFALDIFNKSVFDITIEKELGGLIDFDGTDLLDKKLIKNDSVTCKSASTASITIEQRLSPGEAHLIKSRDRKSAGFYLEHLIVTIKGNKHFPLTPKPLQIVQRGSVLRFNETTTARAQKQREANIKRLTYALGMAHIVKRQLESHELVSKDTLEYLLSIIDAALWDCFDNLQINKDYYGDKLGKVPDVPNEQSKWVRAHLSKLTELIEKERES